MGNDEGLIEDVIISIVKDILMKRGIATYTRAQGLLENYNITFMDCYKKPDVLRSILIEAFGDEHMIVVEQIKSELVSLGDDNQLVSNFIQRLSQ